MWTFTLQYQATIIAIEEPIGWDTIEFVLKKDSNYEGIFYERSGSLKFYANARNLILTALSEKHFESIVIFRAYDACKNNELFFEGRLNFASYNDTDCFFECNIDNKDISIEFINNAERKEDVNLAVSVPVQFHAVLFQNRGVLSAFADNQLISSNTVTTFVQFSSDAGDSVDFDLYFRFETDGTKTFLRCLKAVTINVVIPLCQFGCSQNVCINNGNGTGETKDYSPTHQPFFRVGKTTVAFRDYDFGGQEYDAWQLGNYAVSLTNDPNIVTQSYAVNEIFDIELHLDRSPDPSGCDSSIISYDAANITVFNNTQNETSAVSFVSDPFVTPATKAHFVYEVLEYLIQKASNNKFRLVSNYYGKTSNGYAQNGCGALRMLASGFQVRGKKDKFQTSFKDVYEGLQNIDNLALSFEKDAIGDVVRIEPKDSFFENSIVFNCSDVANVKYSLATAKIRIQFHTSIRN
jgi:hypothetical protein